MVTPDMCMKGMSQNATPPNGRLGKRIVLPGQNWEAIFINESALATRSFQFSPLTLRFIRNFLFEWRVLLYLHCVKYVDALRKM